MSRRHHGNRPPRLGPPRGHDHVRPEPAATTLDGPPSEQTRDDVARHGSDHRPPAAETLGGLASVGPASAAFAGPATDAGANGDGTGPNGVSRPPTPGNGFAPPPGCTAPQLRRFIKSRPYVPMHELRRRFGINGQEDDVSPIDLGNRRVFVGLPAREGSLLGELLRGGDIGYELSLDPRTPIVVGLYPMRPVVRS